MSHVYSHGGPKQDVNLNESILWATTSLWGKHAADFIGHLTIWQYGFFFLQFAITGRWCNPFLLTLFLSVFVHTKKHTHTLSHMHTQILTAPLSACFPSFLTYQWTSRIGGNPRWVLGRDTAPIITSWLWLQPSPQGSSSMTHSRRHFTFSLKHAQTSVPNTLLNKNTLYYCDAAMTVTLSMEMGTHS